MNATNSSNAATETAAKSTAGTGQTERKAGSGRTMTEEFAVRWRWLRGRLVGGVRSLSNDVDHSEVVREVDAEGALSGRFVFMTVMSCAIAALGLLLSSPAVVIGAMLISPLMGPIMLMGFSLCVLDYDEMRRSLMTMAVGVVAALVISILIVAVSPLREATPEILARTKPNLFDLMVAIFSGLAGGYSVIHRKGATIVGVAIATALMPPLAVVGFGIATGSMAIAGGAFFLFMTNLLAIALSVTGLAWLYGFATIESKGTAPFQTVLVLVVFAALSVPLGFALRDIAYEARVQNLVREEALMPFEGKEAMVASLSVDFSRDEPIKIQQTVYAKELVPGAEEALAEHYAAVLDAPVNVQLHQVAVDQNKPIDQATIEKLTQSSVAPLQQALARMDERERSANDIRDAVGFRAQAVDIDPQAKTATIVAARSVDMNLATLQTMEIQMQERFPGWDIKVAPPVQPLPRIAFELNAADISELGEARLQTMIWALKRWEIKKVDVVGQASITSGVNNVTNRRLALNRAEAVATRLRERGFEATASSGYGVAGQAAREREVGRAQFQTAEVRPDLSAVPGDAQPAAATTESEPAEAILDKAVDLPEDAAIPAMDDAEVEDARLSGSPG